MEPLLGSGALERVAREDVMLAFDFDGTLCPIVDDPAQATLPARTRGLLARTAQLYPCVVVSGRTEQDVQARLGGLSIWYAVGNQCLDEPPDVERRFTAVRGWVPRLRASVEAIPGVHVEDKGVSLAIHYRAAADARQACKSIRLAARLLEQVRIVAGKKAVHLFPADGPAKRTALARLRARTGCDRALYFGDDGTDEEAFADAASVIGVRIGASSASAAAYFLRNQSEIDEVLERLVALRAPKRVAPERRRRR
jgi:trehalose 6-phosphate phosphatase